MCSIARTGEESGALLIRSIDCQIVDKQDGVGQIGQTERRVAVRQFLMNEGTRSSIEPSAAKFIGRRKAEYTQALGIGCAKLAKQRKVEFLPLVVLNCLWLYMYLLFNNERSIDLNDECSSVRLNRDDREDDDRGRGAIDGAWRPSRRRLDTNIMAESM